MSLAFRCAECESMPVWTVERTDAIVSWACCDHLAKVCHDMQRTWERTVLTVTLHRRNEEKGS